jgi:hypothetical protein
MKIEKPITETFGAKREQARIPDTGPAKCAVEDVMFEPFLAYEQSHPTGR